MKTINNVQKTTLKSTAVIAMIVLSSFVLNAQGSEGLIAWNSSKGKTVKVDNKDKNDAIVINGVTYSKTWFDEFSIDESESSLRMERWMFQDVTRRPIIKSELKSIAKANEKLNTPENSQQLKSETDKEEALKIESWMFNSVRK